MGGGVGAKPQGPRHDDSCHLGPFRLRDQKGSGEGGDGDDAIGPARRGEVDEGGPGK